MIPELKTGKQAARFCGHVPACAGLIHVTMPEGICQRQASPGRAWAYLFFQLSVICHGALGRQDQHGQPHNAEYDSRDDFLFHTG